MCKGRAKGGSLPCPPTPPPPRPEAAAFILIYFRSEYPNKTSNCLLGAIRRRRERRKTETEEESEAGIKYEPGRLTSCTVTRTQLQRRGRSSAQEVGQEQKSRPREDVPSAGERELPAARKEPLFPLSLPEQRSRGAAAADAAAAAELQTLTAAAAGQRRSPRPRLLPTPVRL